MKFRFDDVCINSDQNNRIEISDYLKKEYNAEIIWAISPLVSDSEALTGRVYPKIWNAYSDHKMFYMMDCAVLIQSPSYVKKATHGLIHVDHRLLDKSAQEMSILVSASLVEADIFVPPFNKYNKDTEKICDENNIGLVKFEDGWRCMEHEPYDPEHDMWYLHARDWNLDKVKEWFELGR